MKVSILLDTISRRVRLHCPVFCGILTIEVVTKKMPILKLDKSDERKEIDFELDFLTSLSRKERFEMMLRKTREIRDLLENSGHREAPRIIKRT